MGRSDFLKYELTKEEKKELKLRSKKADMMLELYEQEIPFIIKQSKCNIKADEVKLMNKYRCLSRGLSHRLENFNVIALCLYF
jgi:hypothetical protein